MAQNAAMLTSTPPRDKGIDDIQLQGPQDMDPLMTALKMLNEAAHAAIRAGRDTTAYPNLNRQKLRKIARMTDEIFENPNVE